MNDGRARGKKLEEQIFAAYEAEAEQRRPNGLRPSELGHECERYLWLRYRWADRHEEFGGRMLRLFDTGQQQEGRIVADLRRLGATIYDRDPNKPTEQIPIEIMGGHSKGFLDGVGCDIPFAEKDYVALEFKTHSEKSFKQLVKDNDFAASKPQHYAQMQLYMSEQQLEEGLYVAVNKNTDEMFLQFIKLDEGYAQKLRDKANRVIHLSTPPPKINQSPTFFKCRFCSAPDICHHGKLPYKSCRTCEFGKPITDAQRAEAGAKNGPIWWCEKMQCALGIDDQKRGCDEHEYAQWVKDMTKEQ